jgi:hypothetical protein
MFAMAMTVAADCESPSNGEVTIVPTAINATNDMKRKKFGLVPSMRNHLESRALRRAWTVLAVWRGACVSPCPLR